MSMAEMVHGACEGEDVNGRDRAACEGEDVNGRGEVLLQVIFFKKITNDDH